MTPASPCHSGMSSLPRGRQGRPCLWHPFDCRPRLLLLQMAAMSKEQLQEFNKKQLARLPPEKREAVQKLLRKKENATGNFDAKTMAVTRTQLANVPSPSQPGRLALRMSQFSRDLKARPLLPGPRDLSMGSGPCPLLLPFMAPCMDSDPQKHDAGSRSAFLLQPSARLCSLGPPTPPAADDPAAPPPHAHRCPT